MQAKDNKNDLLVLTYIGEDYWSRPVYTDQFARLWKDVELGDNEQPSLYSAVNNEFEGEPNTPIRQAFTIEPVDLPSKEKQYQYMMLGRLKADCDYYLGYGHRSSHHLAEGDVKSQIEAMKALWNSFSEREKPSWLSWEKILEYEKEMQ